LSDLGQNLTRAQAEERARRFVAADDLPLFESLLMGSHARPDDPTWPAMLQLMLSWDTEIAIDLAGAAWWIILRRNKSSMMSLRSSTLTMQAAKAPLDVLLSKAYHLAKRTQSLAQHMPHPAILDLIREAKLAVGHIGDQERARALALAAEAAEQVTTSIER
jgi:hypothetical protein